MGLYSILLYKLMPHKNQNILKVAKNNSFFMFYTLRHFL